MITQKKVDIFDVEAIKRGYFITYCVVMKDRQWDTSREEEKYVYKECLKANGIILKVTESELTIMAGEQTKTNISVDRVIKPGEEEREGIRILGIKKDAI